jgi:uncharacterized protein YgiM (DUF1202 family)
MVIRFLMSLVVFLFVAWPVFAIPKFPYTAEAISDRVNIRAGENNNFEIMATLNKGDYVIVTGKNFAWFKVRLPDGSKAFIKSEYTRLITPEVGEVTADRVNVRAAPNTNATILGQVTKGKQLFVKETRPDGWIWIRPVDEISGWVHESLIAFKTNQILPTVKESVVEVPKKMVETKAVEIKPVVKPVFIKQIANGQVECSGKFIKVEGTPPVYKIVREGVVACLVEGPTDVLSRFENMNVVVQGNPQPDKKSSEAPVVAVTKIKLSFQ